MDTGKALAAFLRARRDLVQPEDVGLPSGTRRRVPGLRREEVALLAGISNEYYLRLEQGRDQHPSEQVIDAIASALQLDDASRMHAIELSRARPAAKKRVARKPESVPDGVRMLLATINTPAFVMNNYRDILAVNRLATALDPTLIEASNRLISLFTDPAARSYHPDWDDNTASVVAQLRADIGAHEDDPRFQAIVGELSLKSDRFRRLWARHDIRATGSPTAIIRNPVVGELTLWREKFAILGTTSLVLVIYHAEQGTPSADAVTLLATLSS